MNAVTQIGKDLIRASRIAAQRCWPSTTQPGLSSSALSGSIGMTSVPGHTSPCLPLGLRGFEGDTLVERNDKSVGDHRLFGFEVPANRRDVGQDLGSLVAADLRVVVAVDPRYRGEER